MYALAISHEEELAKRFQDEFLPVSHLLESTIHEGAWFLDSGATKHMTKHWNLLFDYIHQHKDEKVPISDGSTLQVSGCGTIQINNA